MFSQFSVFGETKDKKPWAFSGENGLRFSQISLSNWAAGGESSLAANGYLNFSANYKKKSFIWENKLRVAYGIIKQSNIPLRKSNDNLQYSTLIGLNIKKNWYFTGAFSFKSQFSNGYKYPNNSVPVSKFMAPAFIVLSIGMDYKPNNDFALSISPVSSKITVVNDKYLSDKGAYGVEKGKKCRFEFVGMIKLHFKKYIIKNVRLKTNLQLLSNYLENPDYIDVNWEVFLDMKINKNLSTTIATNLIYDNDILIKDKYGVAAPRVQFKEVFGIGLSYKFGN
jgi:hypothetical protein